MSNKILFFGNERLGTGLATEAPTLRALIAAGYDITGVVIAQNEMNQSRNVRELEIVQVANQRNIPVLAPAKLREAKDELAQHRAEIGVLVAYGKIVPQDIIDLFPRGIVNIHPSLLPKHRGPTPLESVILAGDNETGVSLMQLAAAMDAGPVYAQATISLYGNEAKQELADQLITVGKALLLKHLPAIIDGSLQPTDQDADLATYDQLIKKSDGQLDFNKPAADLAREVRAYAGWPRSRAKIGATEVIVTQAHIDTANGIAGTLWLQGQQLGIYAGDGVLIIDRLVPAGKREMSATAFLAGYNPTLSSTD